MKRILARAGRRRGRPAHAARGALAHRPLEERGAPPEPRWGGGATTSAASGEGGLRARTSGPWRARARWTSATCCSGRCACSRRTRRSARAGRAGSATCWWTSSRTRTRPSTGCSRSSPAPRRNVCVVGDDDQAIYSWRGADVSQHPRLRPGLPGRPGGEARAELPLDPHHPRRGPRGHLEGAPPAREAALDRGRRGRAARAPGRRRTSTTRRSGSRARWRSSAAAARRGEEIAVLYRTNAQSRPIEAALRAARIPYVIVRGTSFYERAEVKDAAAYLRLALSPALRPRPRAGGEPAGARHRRPDRGAAAGPRAPGAGSRSSTRSRSATGSPT